MATTLTADNLTTPPALSTTPPVTDTTPYAGIIASAQAGLPQAQETIDNGAQTTKDSLATYKSISDALLGKAADTAAANTAAGVDTEKANFDKYNQDLNSINANISGLSRQASAIPLQVQENNKNIGATDAGVAPQTTGMLRENAIKALTQASLADIATANIQNSQIRYAAAKDKAQQAVDLKYKPLEDKLAQLKDQLALNKEYITDPAEKKVVDYQEKLLNERARILADQKETDKAISNIGLEVAKNGGDPSVLDGAKTLNEAIDKAAQFLKTPNTEVVKVGDNAAYLIDKNTGKIIRSFGGSTGTGTPTTTVNPKFAGVVQTILGSGKFTKDQSTAISNAINNGEDPFTVVKNNAKNIMGQTEATNLAKFETAKTSIEDLQSTLSQFYALGGDTGIFKGNYEKVINKLGDVSNPALVDLATQIQSTLQVYRNAVSGTAYSAQEGADIASIFPGINKSQGLNEAIIKGRLKAFDSTIDGTYRTALGSAYDKLKNADTGAQITKSGMSDKDFVAKAFETNGGSYDTTVNATPQGQIPVVDNATGQIGYIPFGEYNASKYTKL